MDPALLREREAFKKKAMQLPTVEKRKAKPESSSSKSSKRPKHASTPRPKEPSSDFNYKTMQGSSQYKFSVLAKIVKHMRTRHQEGDFFPLTIDEILDETNQLDITIRVKQWLSSEALLSNPKIDVVEGDKFKFKPKYNIRDRKTLLRLLDKNDQRGLGGIYIDDVEEALPRAQKVMKILGDQITYVTRPIDKKQILFYNDKNFQFTVDDEIVKLWRSVAVDSVDENKIEEYLDKQGITSIHDVGIKKVVPGQKRKANSKRKNHKFKSHNEHMGDVLQDYSEK